MKMTPHANNIETIKALTQVLKSGCIDKYYTDKEIVAEINQILPDSLRLTLETYVRYKNGTEAFFEMEPEKQDLFPTHFQELYDALMMHRMNQKLNIYNAMMAAKGNDWKKYAKLLEDNFDDFNLEKQTAKFLKEQELITRMMKEDLDGFAKKLPF